MTQLTISSFVAAFFAAALLMTVSASAGPVGLANHASEASLLQEVGYRCRWRRGHRYDTEVYAPTTSVRTSESHTAVDAPFTRVRKGPRGTWVRAPFVNIFVPR
jgi:hypothetical protein